MSILNSLLLMGGWFCFQVFGGSPRDVYSMIASAAVGLFVVLQWMPSRSRWKHGFSMFLVVLTVFCTLYHGLDWRIGQRLAHKPHSYVHDHPLQMEAALEALFAGRNPYAISYRGTPMEQWWPGNPALEHVIALPFTFLKSVPFYLLGKHVFGWYDERLSHLPFLALLLFMAYLLPRRTELRLTALILVAFNPLFFQFFIDGRNDVIFLSLLCLGLAAFDRRCWTTGLAALALAACTKHMAWFVLPFAGVYLWQHLRHRRFEWRWVLVPGALVFAIILPFVLWDPVAFWDDIYRYAAGKSVSSFPIEGFGLQYLLHTVGVIPSRTAYFPSWMLQALLLPWLGFLCWQVYRRPTVANVLLAYGFFLWPFLFLARFFHDNYMGAIITVAGLGVILLHDQPLKIARRSRD